MSPYTPIVQRAAVANRQNLLGYTPSVPITAIACLLFLGVGITFSTRVFNPRRRAKFMLSIIIGSFFMAAGIAMRFVNRGNLHSVSFFALENSFVVLSPCAFIAANYMLLGRLARQLEKGHFLLVSPQRLTKVFLTSDITTFLIQAAGGGISSSKTQSSANLGSHLFLIGLSVQLASYLCFTILYLVFLYRVRTRTPETWGLSRHHQADGDPATDYHWSNDWRALAGALLISSIGIIIRSVYRVVEGAQGYFGPLATNQVTVYCLDALPLFIAIAIYIPFWPGRYIDSSRLAQMRNDEKHELVERPEGGMARSAQ